MSELAKRPTRADDNPLAQLPPGWAEPVGLFYAVYSDILRGTVGLAARMRLWEADDGLTLEDAKLAMRRVMRPDKAAAIQHVGMLMAALAEAVNVVLTERRRKERQVAQTAAMSREFDRFHPPATERRGLHEPGP